MEQLNITPSATEEENVAITEQQTVEATSNEKQLNNITETTRRKNLLYEECLGFIPNSMKGRQDPRYVYTKFYKQYKDFDYTNKDFLTIIEEMGLLKQLQILQISKPN